MTSVRFYEFRFRSSYGKGWQTQVVVIFDRDGCVHSHTLSARLLLLCSSVEYFLGSWFPCSIVTLHMHWYINPRNRKHGYMYIFRDHTLRALGRFLYNKGLWIYTLGFEQYYCARICREGFQYSTISMIHNHKWGYREWHVAIVYKTLQHDLQTIWRKFINDFRNNDNGLPSTRTLQIMRILFYFVLRFCCNPDLF